MKIKFKYIGHGGEFLHGVPARDLMEEDWERLTEAQQGLVVVSLLYKEAKNLKAEAEAEAEEENNGG